ncbi:MAG: biotin/lipoyl-binding protein [Thermoflexales bacterium]|nr:biotin/lipoyl-binding protein [Thermoflexales bacterium]
MKYVTAVGEKSFTIDINEAGSINVNGQPRALDFQSIDNGGLYSVLVDNKSFEALVEQGEGEYRVLIAGTLYHVKVVDERAKRLAEAGGAFTPTSGELTIKSPMPGLIVAIPVKDGDVVKKGQVLIVLESMKMENELKAPRDGTVTAIKVTPRQAVEQGQALLTLA